MRLGPFSILAMVAATCAPAAAGKTYRDPTHKFALEILKDFEQVPVEAGEKTEVVKFYDPNDNYGATLTVVRVLKGDVQAAPVTGTPTEADAKRMIEELTRPKSAWDATIGRWTGKDAEPKDAAKIRSADKVDGLLHVVSVPRYPGAPPDHTVQAMLATFDKDGIEYGIFLVSTQRRGERLEKEFKRVARSFRFHDKHAKDVAELPVLDGVNISPKRRAEIEASMIKGWDVVVSPKQNYIVIYNTKNGKNRLLARTIADRIEKIREQVYEVQFPPAKPIDAVSVVRVCKDRDEYHGYGGPGGSAGYWNSASEELVFYDASEARKIDDDTVAVLYHEAFHQYIFYSVGNVAPHSWFNEGHGDVYAGAKYKSGKFELDPFRWRVQTVKDAIREGPRPATVTIDPSTQELRKAWGDKGYTPLADLVSFSQFEYYSYPSVSYAQGWSLVYFLRVIVPEKKAYREKWGHILDVYFDTLKAEVNKSEPLVPGGADDGDEGDGGDDPSPPDGEDPDAPADPDAPGEPEGPDAPGEPPAPGEPGAPSDGGGEPLPPDAPDAPDAPGDPDEPGGDGGEEGDEPPPDPGFQPMHKGLGSQDALKKALEAAFAGVDMAELEKAWAKEIAKL